MTHLVDYTVPTLFPGGQARLVYTEKDMIEVHLPGREAYAKDAEYMLGMIDQEDGGDRIDLYGQGFDTGFLREFSRRVHQVRDESDKLRVLSTFVMARYQSNREPYAGTLMYKHPSETLTVITGIGKNARRSQKNIKYLKERLQQNLNKQLILDGFPFSKQKIEQFLQMLS